MRDSILSKFHTIQPKLFSFKFGCIWPSGSWEKDFYKCSFDCYKFSHVFLLFPFVTIHLNNIVTASPETALCHVWLYVVKWFWKKYEKNENFAERRTGVQKSASELKFSVSNAMSQFDHAALTQGAHSQKHYYLKGFLF